MNDTITDFCRDDLDSGVVKDLASDLDLSHINFDEDLDEEDVLSEFVRSCHRQGKLGFLVQIQSPTVKKLNAGKEVRWGFSHLRWLYGETLDDIIPRASTWALSLEQ